MPKRRNSKRQIIAAVREYEAGGRVSDLADRYGVSASTVHGWIRDHYREQDDFVSKLVQFQTENDWLRKIVADQAIEIESLKSNNQPD